MAKSLTKKKDPVMMPEEYARIRDRLMSYAADCIPISIACAAEGVDWKEWQAREARFPALRQELEKAAALKKCDMYREAIQGKPGWQALFRALELSAEFAKIQGAAGRPASDRNPYDSAMSRKKGK